MQQPIHCDVLYLATNPDRSTVPNRHVDRTVLHCKPGMIQTLAQTRDDKQPQDAGQACELGQ